MYVDSDENDNSRGNRPVAPTRCALFPDNGMM
jgi:hypothetical protein